MKLKQYVAPQAPLVAALDEALAPGGAAALDRAVSDDVWAAALVGPASTFLARPGKDLRAMLVRAGWQLGGGHADAVPPRLARVIEILHAGSLIVDDVEDDSDERRGGPALHRLVGVPIAINTGSWMYFWALSELTRLCIPTALERAVTSLERCHQGQALDLATRVVDLEARDVPPVVASTTRLKTGALCRLATELGALAAGAPVDRVAAIGDLGEAVGCALQMLDDLGCLVAPERRAKAFEDLRGTRPTWAWAWLAEQHDPFAWARFVGQARLVAAGADPTPLADALAERIEATGRGHVRATLDAALAAARAALAPPSAALPPPDAALAAADAASAADADGPAPAPLPTLDALAAELRRMEAMYG